MRELTRYEKEKWLDQYGRFQMDEGEPRFLMGGSELGEAFSLVTQATRMKDYGLSEEFVKAAMVQALDMYYDQLVWFYTFEGEPTNEYGLPDMKVVHPIAQSMGIFLDRLDYGDYNDTARKLWDWIVHWMNLHQDETTKERKISALQHELAILRGKEDGS